MRVAPVPVGSKGVDCDTALTATSATRLKANGVDFVTRYLGSISTMEISAILSAGLGLELVTFAHTPGWTPSATLGAEDGDTDVMHLKALGIPEEMIIWIDLEGSGGDAADTSAWINARSKAIVQAGYVAGVYVGDESVLDSQQLYALPHVTRYWRGFNSGIPTPKCGWCQIQLYPPNQTVEGVLIDHDVSQSDYEGRLPTMLID